tara:strand:- start:2537 stop:2890 length:354 start_codon:yes stop_codon:yes gene_type:complete
MSNKVYSLSFEFLVELLVETQQQYDVVKNLTKDMLLDAEEESKSYIFSLFCEMIWSNLTLISLLEKEIESAVSMPDEGQGEHLMVLENTILTLQNIVLARHHAVSELNKLSISTSIH